MKPEDVIIWSADVAEDMLDSELSREGLGLKLIKLDRLGLTKMGLRKIAEMQDKGFGVFADAKIAEIPDKAIEIAKLHLKHKPWMLNVMADNWSTGNITHENPKKIDSLKRFADLCLEAGTLPCAVTVLTSTDDETPVERYDGKTVVEQKFNGRRAMDQVLVFVEELAAAGFTDVVCSPLEVEAIRSESRFDSLKLNTPGVRVAGDSADDQSRINTPSGALKNGSDRLVIGRSLTNGDLVENYNKIAAELEAA